MKAARPYVPTIASMRARASGDSRTGVVFRFSGGLPIGRPVASPAASDKKTMSFSVAAINGIVYINGAVYGGKAVNIDWYISEAARLQARFWADWEAEPPRFYIGDKCHGLFYRKTLDVIERPHTGLAQSKHVEWLHELADAHQSEGVCYFVGGVEGPIKIGTSLNPKARLSQLRSASPVPLALLATRGGGVNRETAYHAQFAAHRLHGEWFTRCPEIEAEIERLALPHPTEAAR